MKNTVLIGLFSLIILSACQKSQTTPEKNDSLPTGSDTKAQYDNTALGVYKGVFVGSTGIIKMEINNGDNFVRAFIFLDDITRDTLTCTTSFTTGQAITNAHFVGRISSMDFNVDANGSNPSIVNFTIIGHSEVEATIVHETSTQQVFCYQGTYTGSEDGVFDCIKFGSSMFGLAKTSYGDIYRGNGQVVNNSFTVVLGTLTSGTTFGGSFSGDNCSGNWQNTEANYNGTFSGKRTL